jgi:hypothetical protein
MSTKTYEIVRLSTKLRKWTVEEKVIQYPGNTMRISTSNPTRRILNSHSPPARLQTKPGHWPSCDNQTLAIHRASLPVSSNLTLYLKIWVERTSRMFYAGNPVLGQGKDKTLHASGTTVPLVSNFDEI